MKKRRKGSLSFPSSMSLYLERQQQHDAGQLACLISDKAITL